jgi:type IV secretory pathway TrbD component
MNKAFIISKPETLSEVSRDIAQVFFAAMVVGQLIIDDRSWITIGFGLPLSLSFWYVGILFAKK